MTGYGKFSSGIWLVVSVVLIGVLWLVMAWWPRSQPFDVAEWRAQIERCSTVELEFAFKGVAVLGNKGILAIVGTLRSPREMVVEAADRALVREIDRWEMLPVRESFPRVAFLVRALAESIDRGDPCPQPYCTRLAQRLLLWPTMGDVEEHRQLIYVCQRVLRESVLLVDRDMERMGEAETNLRLVHEAWPARALPGDKPSSRGRTQVVRLAHWSAIGEQPMAQSASSLPALNRYPWPSLVRNLTAGGPQHSANRVLAESVLPKESFAELTAFQPLPDRRLKVIREGEVRRPSLAGGRNAIGNPPFVGFFGPQEKSLPAIEVMRLLHDPQAGVAAAAKAELEYRGLTHSQMEIAGLMTNPDPEVRLKLIDKLSGAGLPEMKPWLLWLSEDDHGEVRWTALRLMLRSRDPELRRRAAHLVWPQPDPRD